MENNQITLLANLAKKIQSEEKSKTKILASLNSAKILTKKADYTSHYPNLKKL
jgi:hypothetical protein